MSVHIGIVTASGQGSLAVSASNAGVEVERTIEAHRFTLKPHEALNLAMLLTRAVSEVRYMHTVEGEVDKLVEALQWCAGAEDFQEGGAAHAGFVRVVKPLIDAHRSLKRQVALAHKGGAK